MPDRVAFDHSKHVNQLTEAANLLQDKHPALASAVRKASAIHIDMQGRIAHMQREEIRLRRIAGQLEQMSRDMQTYATKPEAPWLSPAVDLFPRDGVNA